MQNRKEALSALGYRKLDGRKRPSCPGRHNAAFFLLVLFLLSAVFSLAEEEEKGEEKKFKYFSSTSFSFLMTRGNNNNQTFSFDTEQNFHFDKSKFNAKISIINTQKEGQERAEIYSGQLQYNREIKKSAYILGLIAAERNKLAGNEFRFAYSVGIGFIALRKKRIEIASQVSVGRTSESLKKISQLRAYAAYLSLSGSTRITINLSATSQFIHQDNVFLNFKIINDWRIDSDTSLSASISKNFALKASVRIIFDNEPVEGFKSADYFYLTSLVVKI